jgi:hypothetical protein
MADYIDRQILFQAYVHVDPSSFGIEDTESLRRAIRDFIQRRAEFFIGIDVETEILFEDGSLKIKASLYTSIAAAIINAISIYGGFRSGVDYLASDGKALSNATVLECLFQTKSHHNETIHTEARIGVIGQIKRVNNSIVRIQHDISTVDPELSLTRMDRLSNEIRRLRININDQEDVDFVSVKIRSEVETLLPQAAPKNFVIKGLARKYDLARKIILDALEGL